MKIVILAKWLLVLGGVLWAYQGFTGMDFIGTVFGSLEPFINVVLFGGSAAIVAYHLFTLGTKSKK